MSEHKHGSMEIYEQEKTFKGFLKLGRITGYVCVGILAFLMVYYT